MGAVNKFKGRFGRAFNTVFIATSGAELGMAAKRNEIKLAAVLAALYGVAIRRITAIDYFINVFHNNGTG